MISLSYIYTYVEILYTCVY